MTSYADYLRNSIATEEEIEVFLDPDKPSWARFDPEVGYVLGADMPRNGMDASLTISSADRNGARRSAIYAGRPCRINTYGDSFTECHQVSDHETWQEYLAAHLGEPVRNFGVGGFGFYQAYRRMARTETGNLGAQYVILYIWGDDHYRSLLRCRHALLKPFWNSRGGRLFHGNFWANLEMDLQTGKFVERDNLSPTPESLYRMADPAFMAEALGDDWMLWMSVFCSGAVEDIDLAGVNRLAGILQCDPVTATGRDETVMQVRQVRDAYAFAATRHIIDRAVEFIGARGKELLVVLFDPFATRQLITTGTRYEQSVVDYLRARSVRYFDMNLAHVADFKQFNVPLEAYMKRYFIGHYNPAGNHFFAFAIKDTIVEWLDPKPITYRQDGQALVDFKGYLPS